MRDLYHKEETMLQKYKEYILKVLQIRNCNNGWEPYKIFLRWLNIIMISISHVSNDFKVARFWVWIYF